LGDMEGRGLLWAFAWAEDSRTEAFEALRVPARMLGVRKGGLGVKVSLFGKELMLPVDRLVAQVVRVSPLPGLPCSSACHASCAGWARKGLVGAWQT